MKKRLLSLLLAAVMLLTLLPTVAFAEGNVCKIGGTEYGTLAEAVSADGESKTIVLLKDCESVDFGGAALTLDLNGFRLTGTSVGAGGVTIANSGAKQATLEAVGVYANNCSAFAADGYAAVDNDSTVSGNDGTKVISTTEAGVYTVKVVTSIDEDRATTRTDANAAPGEDGYVDEQDVYAGDTVYAEIRVYGARFVGADVTLGYDTDKFDMTDSPMAGWTGDDEDSDEDATGYTRFQNAKAGTGTTYYEPTRVDESGEYYYSLGEFEFEAKTCTADAFDIPFTVKAESGAYIRKTYVAGAWSDGWNSTAANELAADKLVNAKVNIRVVKMTANVTATSELTYDTSAKTLVNPVYTVVDTLRNEPVTGTTIEYIVQTKEEAEGVQETDDFGDLLYWTDGTKTEKDTVKTDWPVYAEGKEPVARGDAWSTELPKKTDAGKYVIYYRVSKTGYATVESKLENSIAQKEIDLTWTNGGFTKGVKQSENTLPAHQYWTDYATGGEGTAKTMPGASFIDGSNTTQNAIITVTKKDGAATTDTITELKDVAVYELTATLDPAIADNYIIKNATVKVLIDGSAISGYSLANADGEGAAKWYDAENHTPAKLVEAEDKTEGVTIAYTVLKDGVPMEGKTGLTEIPEDLKEVGVYTVKATVTKAGYYDKELTPVTFTIKSVEFKVEKADWVTGWDVVFVYTKEAGVHFTYDGLDMFDMSSLKVNGKQYKFENKDENNYPYVYGIAVFGDADTTLVVPSNGGVKTIDNTQGTDPVVVDARCNINNSPAGAGITGEKRGVDMNDLVACQAVYNVSEEYLKTKNIGTEVTADVDDEKMAIVLKADVNGDKKIDTNDCAEIKRNSENN